MHVVVLDNLCNSSVESLHRVAELAGRAPVFVQGDVRDRALLDSLFAEHSIQSVLHFAGLKAVGESVQQPLRYYDNNMHGSQVLLEAMLHAGVLGLVFSSSVFVNKVVRFSKRLSLLFLATPHARAAGSARPL